MSLVIIARGTISNPDLLDGQYLKSYDPEAFDGRGDATFTDKIEQALRFNDIVEAMDFVRTVPASRPLREDGNPNRPLTAFTLEFRDPEAGKGTQT